MLRQHSLAVGVALNELHGLKAAKPAGGEAEATDATEGVEEPEGHDAHASSSITTSGSTDALGIAAGGQQRAALSLASSCWRW